MNLRRTLAAATAGLALAGGAAFAPATAVPIAGIDVAVSCSGAGCTGTTPVELTVIGGGTLSISAPAPAGTATHVDLGSVNAGSIAAQTPNSLGQVTVTDTRTGVLNNNWVMAAQASDLLLSGKTAETAALNERIPAASLGYVAGTITKAAGSALSATPLAVDAPSLALSVPVVTTVSLGANTISWSPKLAVTVLPTTVAGKYTGTVTHSAL